MSATDLTASPHWRFDHLNLRGRADDAALARLFGGVMGLRPGYRPPFPFPGQWLYRGDEAWLHLVQPSPTQDPQPRLGHIAFRTDQPAAALIERVRAAGLAHEIAVVPEQGEVQVFVPLPGGLVIELDAPADPAYAGDGVYRSRLARGGS
ncbi:hypothetical protein A7A76_06660 [Lysobacter enzymogenes]|uniref:hypothetical protein n=1 Tax=Lysobacter enzymogenes TaxID=69 RepID=UPI0019D07E56|nr:hypothetical protein [Lysobacter enzymogenes]MBN7138792.1 hypothetical protein [Lysobacter enzymogenes]